MTNERSENQPPLIPPNEKKIILGLMLATGLTVYILNQSGDRVGARCCAGISPAVFLILLSGYLREKTR